MGAKEVGRDIPSNSDIAATLFSRFWPDLPMICLQSVLEKKAIFLPLTYCNSS
jgi:hypothetical protein